MKKLFFGFFVATFAFAGMNVAHASFSWKDFFSYDQMAAIKKATNTSVINSLKKDSDWKNVISGRNIKDNAITSDKIQDGTITGNDLSSNIAIGDTNNATVSLGKDSMLSTINITGQTGIAAHYWGVTPNGVGSFTGGLEVNGVENGYVDFSEAKSMRIPVGAGAPASGDCDSTSDLGKLYLDTSSVSNGFYVCSNNSMNGISWNAVAHP